MRKSFNNKRVKIIFMLIAMSGLLTACGSYINRLTMSSLSQEEQQNVTTFIQNSPTRCIGLYLIDLPEGFAPTKQEILFDYNYGEARIDISQQYYPAFKQMITKREAELRNTTPYDKNDIPFLKGIYPVYDKQGAKTTGIIFERMKSNAAADFSRILEGYRFQNDVVIKINKPTRNGTDKKYDEDRIHDPEFYSNHVPQDLKRLQTLFNRIQPRNDLTIPNGPGVCLKYSFMEGVDESWKDIDYTYAHKEMNGFMISFSTDDYAPDYKLLKKPDAYLTQGKHKILYKGTREVNGLEIEEAVVRGNIFYDPKTNEDFEGYEFTLAINMTNPTYQFPKMIIEMSYKVRTDGTGFNEAELMAIWKHITSTIRLRPGAMK